MSKFVTVVVQPNEFGEIEPKVYMVSEIGQQLERDNCLATDKDKPKMMFPRVAGENEIVPPFLTKGTTVKEFDPEFLLVKLEQGEPKHKMDYNILKIHQPELYRGGKMGPVGDFKGYLKLYKSEPSQRRFACFHLLLFIADRFDLDTAIAMA